MNFLRDFSLLKLDRRHAMDGDRENLLSFFPQTILTGSIFS